MRRDCPVLLIADDELACDELTRALGPELVVSQTIEGGAPTTFGLRYETIVLGGAWEISLRDARYDLCIVAARGDSPARFLGADALARSHVAATLFVVDAALEVTDAWRLRPNTDRVLARPFTDRQLALAVERLLLAALRRDARSLADQDLIALLRGVVEGGKRVLTPTLTADSPGCATWPDVGRHLGPLVDEQGVLERLAGLGLLRRAPRARVRVCPTCESLELAYGETCVGCGSVDFAQETMIHHFACAHVDGVAAFRRGVDLVCPKCAKTLRQIGRDYEKPTGLFRCRACATVASDTRVVATCLNCRGRCKPEATRERVLHAYEATPLADEAIAAGSLGGFDLATALRDREDGLYAKGFLIYEIGREMARWRRYGAACSLLVARLANLDEVRVRMPERTGEYIRALARAVTQDLRDLDITAIWSGDALATLLPMTDAAGAEVVAARIERAARACGVSFELDLPGVSIARATAGTGVETAEALIGACDPQHLEGVTTFGDQFVVLDDETGRFG